MSFKKNELVTNRQHIPVFSNIRRNSAPAPNSRFSHKMKKEKKTVAPPVKRGGFLEPFDNISTVLT